MLKILIALGLVLAGCSIDDEELFTSNGATAGSGGSLETSTSSGRSSSSSSSASSSSTSSSSSVSSSSSSSSSGMPCAPIDADTACLTSLAPRSPLFKMPCGTAEDGCGGYVICGTPLTDDQKSLAASISFCQGSDEIPMTCPNPDGIPPQVAYHDCPSLHDWWTTGGPIFWCCDLP